MEEFRSMNRPTHPTCVFLVFFIAALACGLPVPGAAAQATGTIAGTVAEAEGGEPLEGVNVVLSDLGRGAATGPDGGFRLTGVPAGTHELVARFVGYERRAKAVTVRAGETVRLSFALAPTPLGMEGIEVSALRPGLEPESSLEAEQIRRAEVADPGALLRGMPGIGSARRGPIGLDPNVRGLSEAEVGVYVNGMRTFPAGPARMDSPMSHIDPSTIASINVVKGPYALTWGPGNMSAIRVTQRGENPPRTPLTGTVRTGYDSNLGAREATGFAMGRQGRWFYSANAAWRDGDDYTSGAGGSVPGSFTSADGRGRIGAQLSERSTLSVSGSFQQQDDLDYPGRLLNATFFTTGMGQLDYAYEKDGGLLRSLTVRAGVQQTLHEMDNRGKPTYEAGAERPPLRIGVESEIQNVSGRVAADLAVGKGWDLTLGADALHTYRNAIRTLRAAPPGREPFVPPFYRTADGEVLNRAWPGVTIAQQGAFVRVRRPVGGALTLTGTARADLMRSDADDPTGPFLQNAGGTQAGLDRRDAALSGALTASVPLAKQWSLSLGAGSVVRPPTALERYSDRFPATKSQTSAEFQGTPSLDPERSTQADLWIEGGGSSWALSVNGFARRVSNYITLEPVGPDAGIEPILPLSPPTVYRYVNGTARFVGAEVQGSVSLLPALSLRASGSWLRGRDETRDEPAFGVAPPSAAVGARWSPEVGLSGVAGAYLDAALNLSAEQDRVAASRGESPTDGYATVDLRAGARLLERVELKVAARNVFDVAYTNHLNAKNPFTGARIAEPGRVVSTTLTVRF
jgi:iron complex outermembrane receptor protein